MSNKKKPEDKAVELKEEIQIEEVKKEKFCFWYKLKIFIMSIVVFVVFTAIVLQDKEIKQKFIDAISVKGELAEVEKIYEEIYSIKQVLKTQLDDRNNVEALNDDFLGLTNRFDILEQNNLNTIKSKADVSLLLGAVQRIDILERKLDKMNQISNQGALIATATMLVKDAANRGGNFLYEYSILSKLSENEPDLKEYMDDIHVVAKDGLERAEDLYSEFNRMHQMRIEKYIIETTVEQEELEDSTVSDEEKTNIDKFNKTFGKLISIKFKKKTADSIESEVERQIEKNKKELEKFEKLATYVYSHNLNDILREFRKEEYSEILSEEENEDVRIWLLKMKKREQFIDAISNITAYSLGIMRVGNL